MKNKVKSLAASALFAVLISGCANVPATPAGYTGPTAKVTDTFRSEGRSKGRFFVLGAIDGQPIDSALTKSAEKTAGRGFALSGGNFDRMVPARPLKVKLVGTHRTGAPIHELFSRAAGTFFHVEGEVAFTPKPDGNYVVRGELKENGSEIWIEDAWTHELVTEKIIAVD
jgi:hypothetical protein